MFGAGWPIHCSIVIASLWLILMVILQHGPVSVSMMTSMITYHGNAFRIAGTLSRKRPVAGGLRASDDKIAAKSSVHGQMLRGNIKQTQNIYRRKTWFKILFTQRNLNSAYLHFVRPKLCLFIARHREVVGPPAGMIISTPSGLIWNCLNLNSWITMNVCACHACTAVMVCANLHLWLN